MSEKKTDEQKSIIIRKLTEKVEAQQAEIARLCAALEVYAGRHNWDENPEHTWSDIFKPTNDGWEVAEIALKGGKQ